MLIQMEVLESRIKTHNSNITTCAVNDAHAAPSTPIGFKISPKPLIKITSKKILTTPPIMLIYMAHEVF